MGNHFSTIGLAVGLALGFGVGFVVGAKYGIKASSSTVNVHNHHTNNVTKKLLF